MKKIISIALFAAAFGLVGCASQDNPDQTAHRDYTAASADYKAKCKGHKVKKCKLGVEKTCDDTAK